MSLEEQYQMFLELLEQNVDDDELLENEIGTLVRRKKPRPKYRKVG
ncbi:hypothetical protein [Gracilibacillus phocaeensis]|nr:hypothetical protein [Gracilibacillus phocaeensis]